MNIFGSITSIDWGFKASDIFSNASFIFRALAGFIVLGLIVRYVPTYIEVIRAAVGYKRATGKHLGIDGMVEEFMAVEHYRKERRARRRAR